MTDAVPEAWPPAEIPPGQVPVFPLPGVFLFPGTLLPLHIYESRYRLMIEDLLDKRGWLVISAIEAGHEIRVGRFPFQASGRALSTQHATGLVKVVATEDGPDPMNRADHRLAVVDG